MVWKLEYDWKPVFFFHSASRGDASWYDCGGQTACPSVKQVPTGCPPVADTCGTFVHPAVEIGLFGGTSEAEGPAVLRQGETGRGQVRAVALLHGLGLRFSARVLRRVHRRVRHA